VTLARQIGEVLTKVPELDMSAAVLAGSANRRREQRTRSAVVVREDTAVVQERQRHQRAAEEPAIQKDGWQHPDDLSAAARREIQRPAAEGTLEHIAPDPLVIPGRVDVPQDVLGPLAWRALHRNDGRRGRPSLAHVP
jgi:hypothetical protein